MEFGGWFVQFPKFSRLLIRSRSRHRSRRYHRAATPLSAIFVDVLEPRVLLTSDYGDAPDSTSGTGVNDYQTLASNDGPSHAIDSTQNTLFLGGSVDGEVATQQSVTATRDDRFTTGGRDDEDGVLNSNNLFVSAGTSPRITLAATNTTGIDATLYGWIDYNTNGVFENATERAQIAVPTGTTNGRFTLSFPASQINFAGATYARFRLSSDVAAADPIGAASGGEVEDYQFQILNRLQASFLVDYTTQSAGSDNGLPAVSSGDVFGISVASLGDLDGNGAEDLAVGAPGDSSWRGAVYVLFRNADGSVNRSVKIANSLHGGPALSVEEGFGASVASLGDIDGDGITDLAVGAYNETASCSVYIVRMNANGTAKNFTQLASQKNGIPQLSYAAQFCFVRSIGDFDGDGIGDIVIGAPGVGYINRGAIYVVRLNANGTAKNVTAIHNTVAWNPSVRDEDNFGTTIASLGDIDHDGVGDLAVVTEGGGNGGAVNILKLKPDGSLKSVTQLTMGDRADPFFSPVDANVFGLVNAGDIDGNGVNDLVYSGSRYSNPLGKFIGVINTLLLNEDGTFKGNTDVISLGDYVSDSIQTYSTITFLGPTADGDRQLAVTSPFPAVAAKAKLTVLTLRNRPAVIPDATTVVLDSSSTENPRPTVKWNSSANASSYIVWVRNLSTGVIVVNSVEVIGTEYTPATDWGIGKYSVCVRAKSKAGVSAWSPRRDFLINTRIETTPVAATMNPAPTLSWKPQLGAAKYDVWLADLKQPTKPIFRVNIDGVTTSVVPPQLASGTYRLQLRGIAADGSPGLWSQPMDFAIVRSPTITSVLHQTTSAPDVSFTAVPGVVNYDMWISHLTTPSQPAIRITTLDASTKFRLNETMASGKYRIWIRGVAADGSLSSWSKPKDFSVGLAPQLTTSKAVFGPEEEISLSWDAIEGARDYYLYYQAPRFAPENKWTTYVGNVTSYNYHKLDSIGTHRFMISATSADGRAGRWSDIFEVTVKAPVESVRVSSSAGAFDRPTFAWSPLSGAASYEVRIDDIANNVPGWITATNLVTFSFSSSMSLPLGAYSFQVRGIAKDGTVGEWSEPLIPQASQVPQLLPTDGNFTFQPELQWTPVAGATTYTLIVWNADTGKSLGRYNDRFTPSAIVSVPSEGQYTWTVRANGPGLPALMSEPQTFTVTTRPELIVPTTFESDLETNTIDWTKIEGAWEYDIWISTDQNIKVLQGRAYLFPGYNLPSDLPKGTYRVWVRAVSRDKDLSPWSLPAIFEII